MYWRVTDKMRIIVALKIRMIILKLCLIMNTVRLREEDEIALFMLCLTTIKPISIPAWISIKAVTTLDVWVLWKSVMESYQIR